MRGSVARRSNYEQSWFGDGAVEWVAVKLGVRYLRGSYSIVFTVMK